MIDWNKAPEGATHCWIKHEDEWRKVTEDNVFWWCFKRKAWIPFVNAAPKDWLAYYDELVVARPVVKKAVVKKPVVRIFVPLVAGEALTIDKLKTTRAYEQMVNFIKNNNGTPAQLGVLVKKFLREFNLQKDNMTADVAFRKWFEAFNDDNVLSSAFLWLLSKEGNPFWARVALAQNVGNLAVFLGGQPPAIGQPVKIPPPAPPVAPAVVAPANVVPEAKKKVGWW